MYEFTSASKCLYLTSAQDIAITDINKNRIIICECFVIFIISQTYEITELFANA